MLLSVDFLILSMYTTTEKSERGRRCLIASCRSLRRDLMPPRCSSFPRPHRRARSAIPLRVVTLYASIQCFLNTLHVNVHRGMYAGVLDVTIHSHLRKGTYRYCGMQITLSLLSRRARHSRRWSCCYLQPPRHALLHRHRAPDGAPEVSPSSIDREVVGEAVVVAPDEDVLPEPEDRDIAAHGGVVEACLPWSDLRPSCQDLRDDLRHQCRYMSVLSSKGVVAALYWVGLVGAFVCIITLHCILFALDH
jgi:hypothetical protein